MDGRPNQIKKKTSVSKQKWIRVYVTGPKETPRTECLMGSYS